METKLKFRVIYLPVLFLLGIGKANEFRGIWLPLKTSRGGLGTQINIFSESEINFTFGAIVKSKYHLTNDTLSIMNSMDDLQVSNKYLLVRDTLFSIVGDSIGQVKMKGYLESRKPKIAIDSIIGTWTFKHYTEAPAYYCFARNMICYLHVQMVRKKATYNLVGNNKMEVVIEKGKPNNYSLDKTNMLLVDDRGLKYERFDFQSEK